MAVSALFLSAPSLVHRPRRWSATEVERMVHLGMTQMEVEHKLGFNLPSPGSDGWIEIQPAGYLSFLADLEDVSLKFDATGRLTDGWSEQVSALEDYDERPMFKH